MSQPERISLPSDESLSSSNSPESTLENSPDNAPAPTETASQRSSSASSSAGRRNRRGRSGRRWKTSLFTKLTIVSIVAALGAAAIHQGTRSQTNAEEKETPPSANFSGQENSSEGPSGHLSPSGLVLNAPSPQATVQGGNPASGAVIRGNDGDSQSPGSTDGSAEQGQTQPSPTPPASGNPFGSRGSGQYTPPTSRLSATPVAPSSSSGGQFAPPSRFQRRTPTAAPRASTADSPTNEPAPRGGGSFASPSSGASFSLKDSGDTSVSADGSQGSAGPPSASASPGSSGRSLPASSGSGQFSPSRFSANPIAPSGAVETGNTSAGPRPTAPPLSAGADSGSTSRGDSLTPIPASPTPANLPPASSTPPVSHSPGAPAEVTSMENAHPGNGSGPPSDGAGGAPLKAPMTLTAPPINSTNPPTSPRGLQPLTSSPSSAGGAISGGPGVIAVRSDRDKQAGLPGPRRLEGAQSPSLTIEKTAPQEIQVNRPATFKIVVRNTGKAEAQDVVVVDDPPKGVRFLDASPPPDQSPDGGLRWRLGNLPPGEEKEIAINLLPLEEGEIGSVARLVFAAEASARTVCTKPQLTIRHTAPTQVLIGKPVPLSITISNPGTGAAEDVVLEEDVPEGLDHPAGKELEYEVGVLRPGETRNLQLELQAEKPGLIRNVLVVRGAGNLAAQDEVNIEVIAPKLEVAVNGPSKRFLQRQATYALSLLNGGTAAARKVSLVAYLPKGLKFIQANNQGQYDARNHAVYWSLEELPPKARGDVQLTALPQDVGEQKIRVEGRAELGLADVKEHLVQVEGSAELLFSVADSADPIEVGAESVYQVKVVNQGSKSDTNIRISAQLPPELEPVAGDGPTQHNIAGRQIVFEPLARLAPKEEALFKIQVRGLLPGNPRIKVQLSSDEAPTPVTKEEGTRVYQDK